MSLDDLVESYFAKRGSPALANLTHLYEQALQEMLKENAGVDPGEDLNIDIKFPKIRITEDFGSLGTEDRAIIEKFTRNIKGDTLQAKIAYLNNILTTKQENVTIGEILSTMVVCEILSAIITNFTESAGGFIFEGFLAGLFGGESVQITSPEDIGSGATGKPITDVVLAGKHYSLKLLGDQTAVKGSFKNMVEHLKDYDHVIYLDARRIGGTDGLQFGEFTITLEGFLDIFVVPFLKTVWRKEADNFEDAAAFQQKLSDLLAAEVAIKKITFGQKGFLDKAPGAQSFVFSKKLNEVGLGSVDMSDLTKKIIATEPEELQRYAGFSVQYAESKFENTKAAKLFGSYAVVEQLQRAIESGNKEAIFDSLEKTPGYQEAQQFEFQRAQVEEKITNFQEIGTLMIGPKYMKSTFAMYAELLKATISPVYEQLQFFTNNVNDYFLGVSDESAKQDRKQYALNAIENAKGLEVATAAAVEKIEK
tara:strand:- start:3222 stop:4658 length:1437 start_codon:yes stop_codon:yes gene_type:complete